MITINDSIRRLQRALRDRVGRADDERGVAMLSALLFVIAMLGITVVIVAVVVSQITPSNIAQKNTRTIYAAQAGMQTALAILRGAAAPADVAGRVYGDPTKLPCSLTGRVNAQADGLTYSVALSYFTTDPTGQTSAWMTSNKLACSAATGLATQPTYVAIVSQGLAPAIPRSTNAALGNRLISAVYKFKVTNVNVSGGRFYDSTSNYCLRATSATNGSTVNFLPVAQCSNDELELWIYDTDYKLKLASTTVGGGAGLCITGPAVWGQPTQNALLQPCLGNSDPARWNQLWSWTNSFRGQKNVINDGLSNYCLSTGFSNGTVLTGRPLLVGSSCNGGLTPTLLMGAGAASYATKQIVNYREFGRCADVTNEQINYAFMIVYPCKQDATGTGAGLLWNHKWYYTEPTAPATSLGNQQIYVYLQDKLTDKYCLTTPTGNNKYPVFATCDNSARQNWTRVYSTGNYLTSYVFTDNSGRCLTSDNVDTYGVGSVGYSKMTVKTCTGSEYQKWNAPPTSTDSTVASYKEISP